VAMASGPFGSAVRSWAGRSRRPRYSGRARCSHALRSRVAWTLPTLGIALVPALVVLGSLGAGVLTGRDAIPRSAQEWPSGRGIVLVMLARPFGAILPDLTAAFLLGRGRGPSTTYLLRHGLYGDRPRGLRARSPPSIDEGSMEDHLADHGEHVGGSVVAHRRSRGRRRSDSGRYQRRRIWGKAYFAIVRHHRGRFAGYVFTRWSRSASNYRDLWRELRALRWLGDSSGGGRAGRVFRGLFYGATRCRGTFLQSHLEAVGLIGSTSLPSSIYGRGFAVRALIAIDATRPLIWLGLVKATTNIIGDIVLARMFGLPGIALATIAAESLIAILGVAVARAYLKAPKEDDLLTLQVVVATTEFAPFRGDWRRTRAPCARPCDSRRAG